MVHLGFCGWYDLNCIVCFHELCILSCFMIVNEQNIWSGFNVGWCLVSDCSYTTWLSTKFKEMGTVRSIDTFFPKTFFWWLCPKGSLRLSSKMFPESSLWLYLMQKLIAGKKSYVSYNLFTSIAYSFYVVCKSFLSTPLKDIKKILKSSLLFLH